MITENENTITKQMVKALLDHDLEVYGAKAHELLDDMLKDYSDDEDVTKALSNRATAMTINNVLTVSNDVFSTDHQVMLTGGITLELAYADFPSAHNFYRWISAQQEAKTGTKKPAIKSGTLKTNELKGGENE